MIELDVKPFCSDCYLFEPEVDKLYSDDKLIVTRIVCENRNLCNAIEKQLKKGDKDVSE